VSWEPGLELPMRIKMMMKLQKRNMNKELEVVLLTSSIRESIIIFFNQKNREIERREKVRKKKKEKKDSLCERDGFVRPLN